MELKEKVRRGGYGVLTLLERSFYDRFEYDQNSEQREKKEADRQRKINEQRAKTTARDAWRLTPEGQADMAKRVAQEQANARRAPGSPHIPVSASSFVYDPTPTNAAAGMAPKPAEKRPVYSSPY
jgi:hypothetical protein